MASDLEDTLRAGLQCYPFFPPRSLRDYAPYNILFLASSTSNQVDPRPTGATLLDHVDASTRAALINDLDEERISEPFYLLSSREDSAKAHVHEVSFGGQQFRRQDVFLSKQTQRFMSGDSVAVENAVRTAWAGLVFQSGLRHHLRNTDNEKFMFAVVTEVRTANLSAGTASGVEGQFSALNGELSLQTENSVVSLGEGVVGIRMICFLCRKLNGKVKISEAIRVAHGDEDQFLDANTWVRGGPDRFFGMLFSSSRMAFVVMDVISVRNDSRLDRSTREYLLRVENSTLGEEEHQVTEQILGIYGADLWKNQVTNAESEKLLPTRLEALLDLDFQNQLIWYDLSMKEDLNQRSCNIC